MGIADSGGPTDAEILRRFVKGDKDAFRLLFERYEGRVVRYLARHFNLADSADDVGQQTFIRLLVYARRHPGVWPADESIEPLVMFMAARAAADYLRRELRLRERDTRFAIFSAEERSSKEAAATISAIGIDVQRALAALPPNLREVAQLYFIEDYKGTDAAEEVESTPNAIKKKAGRARQRLQLHLKHYWKGTNHDLRISAGPPAGRTADEVSSGLRR